MNKSNNIIDCKCQAFPYDSYDTSSLGQPPPEMDNGEGREEPQTPRTLYFNCSQSDIPLGLTYSMDTTGYKYDVYSLLKLTHAL